MDPKFTSRFIAECAKAGIDSNDAIIEKAKCDIAKIDEILRQAEESRLRKADLIRLLEHLGDTTLRRGRSSEIQRVEIDEDNTEAARAARKRIVKLIGKVGRISNRELRAQLGYSENITDRLIIRAVKWLGEREIIDRDRTTSDNKIIAGPKFFEADTLLSKTNA